MQFCCSGHAWLTACEQTTQLLRITRSCIMVGDRLPSSFQHEFGVRDEADNLQATDTRRSLPNFYEVARGWKLTERRMNLLAVAGL